MLALAVATTSAVWAQGEQAKAMSMADTIPYILGALVGILGALASPFIIYRGVWRMRRLRAKRRSRLAIGLTEAAIGFAGLYLCFVAIGLVLIADWGKSVAMALVIAIGIITVGAMHFGKESGYAYDGALWLRRKWKGETP